MKTSRWALESSFDARIKAEAERKERILMRDALDYIAELRAEELADNDEAYEVEPLERYGY